MSSEITFASFDAQAFIDELVAAVESQTGETLYPADVRRIFIKQLTPPIAAVYSTINDTARQTLLRYARGAVLDAIGEMSDTPRLPSTGASCIVQFTASPGHPGVTIPIGTRVSPDGTLYFMTDADAVIAVGSTTVTANVVSLGDGEEFNGFTAGQIGMIIDPVPYLASVSNTTESSGGADEEADGSMTPPYSDYRARIREAPAKYSTAGPEEAYIYWAKTASAGIASVTATCPSAGEIVITVLMRNGAAPSQAVLNAVLAACSARNVRPLGDHVTAQAPAWVNFTISVEYTINAAFASSEAAIRAAIEGTGGAIEQYIAWQIAEIDRDITPSQLIRYMYGAGEYDDTTRKLLVQGMQSVTVNAPAAAAVSNTKAAHLSGTPTITYGGMV